MPSYKFRIYPSKTTGKSSLNTLTFARGSTAHPKNNAKTEGRKPPLMIHKP